MVKLLIRPRFDSGFSTVTEAYVIPKISSYWPKVAKNTSWLAHLKNLVLADPNFWKAKRIDMLLGSSVHATIIELGICKGSLDEPIAMKSKFGWLLSGNSTAAGKISN